MKYCSNCGNQLNDSDLFCEACGQKSAQEPAPLPDNPKPVPGKVLRWRYDLPLLRTPVILFLLWKIFGYIVIGIWFVLGLLTGDLLDFDWLIASALIAGLLFALTLISYLIYAIWMKGYYRVLFEMDDTRISHMQLPADQKKAAQLGSLLTLAGASANNVGTVGQGMILADQKGALTTDFASVRSVIILRRYNTIKVNGLLTRNQIYVKPEAFDTVLTFILNHIPAHAKVRGA